MENKNNEGLTQLDLVVWLRRMVRGLQRWWFLTLILAVIGGLLAYRNSNSTYWPMYKAEAILSITVGDGSGTSSQYFNSEAARAAAKTFPYILQSEVMQERMRAQLDGGIQGSIQTTAMADTNLLTLTVTGSSPKGVYNTIQAVITVYPQVSQTVMGETQLMVIREPVLPTEPYNSAVSRQSGVVRGILNGALLGLFLAAVLGMLHFSVMTSDEVKKTVDLPCIAKVPKALVKRRKSGKVTGLLISNPGTDESFSEAFRLLRLRLLREMNTPEEKVILFTSSMPSEGKSSVAVNTALALAREGKRVLLIDADLRNPSVKSVMGLNSRSDGLGELLSNASKEIKFYRYKETSLFLFAGDQPIKDPTALLQYERLSTLFQALRPMFEYIVVDTPPSCMMADATALCRHADKVVYVVREDWVSKNQIRDGVLALSNSGVKLCGFVMNSVTHTSGSRYGYGYGTRHGYGKRKKEEV